MRKHFEQIMKQLDYGELMQLKADLDTKGTVTKEILEATIKEKQSQHAQVCATCSSPTRMYSKHNYTLVFGPDDFKRKASFCGIDCLEHFLHQLKSVKKC